MKVEEFVFETFLRLTSKTVPYGSEDILVESMRELFPKGMQKDEWGNYFYKVGESRSIFAAHLDTVSKDYVTVTHVFDGNLIKTDGKTTLGADDKAGITILLWMIQNNVPGLYYFFIGEEVGCIGSGKAAKSMDFSHINPVPKSGFYKGNYDRIISFDRRDVGSVITFQSSSRCCSDDFADALCRELNQTRKMSYKKDTGGVYTDSAEFTHLVPECTNVSVGYYKEHTTNESQDIIHLTNLAEACVKVDWEKLPTKRDPNTNEWKDYSYPTSRNWSRKDYGYNDDYYDYGNYESMGYGDSMSDAYGDSFSTDTHSNRGKKKRKRNKSKKYYDNGSHLEEMHGFDQCGDYPDPMSGNDFLVEPIKDIVNSDSKYDWIISKFTDTGLEYSELQIIKEQYLDMNSAYDKYFYDYLLEQMYEKGKSEII
jgi:hypothetical protein